MALGNHDRILAIDNEASLIHQTKQKWLKNVEASAQYSSWLDQLHPPPRGLSGDWERILLHVALSAGWSWWVARRQNLCGEELQVMDRKIQRDFAFPWVFVAGRAVPMTGTSSDHPWTMEWHWLAPHGQKPVINFDALIQWTLLFATDSG